MHRRAYQTLCDASTCTDGVSCAAITTVGSDGELTSALASAAPGDCIALQPGSYAAVTLPMDVSLLGRSAAEVKVAAVTLAEGSSAWVRGLEVSGGFDTGETTTVHIEAVRIVGSHTGLRIGPGATVSLTDSTITGTDVYGLTGAEAAAITLTRSVIADSGGPGLWVKCANGCDCPTKPVVSLDRVLIRGNRLVSAAFVGVQATLNLVDITDSLEFGFEPGGGLLATGCADVTANGVAVANASSFGVLVDGASASLGGGPGEEGIIIVNSRPGVWLQRIGAAAEEPDQTVVLDGAEVVDCSAAGMGFDHEAQGIIIVNSKVANTGLSSTPVEPIAGGGQGEVGLGVVWKRMSAVSIDGLSVSGSGGHGVLIDGPVATGSTLANVTLGGGDDGLGIAQQQVTAQDEAPSVAANAPAVVQHAEKIADVPVGLTAPTAP